MNTQPLPVRLVRLRFPAITSVLLPLAVAALASVPAVAGQAQFDVMIYVNAAQTRPQTGVCDSTNTVDGPTLVCKARPVTEIATTLPPVSEILAPANQVSEPSVVVTNPPPSSGGTSPAASPTAASQTAKSRAVYEGAYRVTSAVTGAVGSVDIYTSAGMSTAFRLVSWADREYIEMTVRW